MWNETFKLIFKHCSYIEYLEKCGALKIRFDEKLCICGGRRIFLTLSFGYFYAGDQDAVRYERHFITVSSLYAIICFTFSLKSSAIVNRSCNFIREKKLWILESSNERSFALCNLNENKLWRFFLNFFKVKFGLQSNIKTPIKNKKLNMYSTCIVFYFEMAYFTWKWNCLRNVIQVENIACKKITITECFAFAIV